MDETSTVGEITERSSYFREITWKINRASAFSSEEGYKIRSPAFYFIGVNCNLSVCPNGTKEKPGEFIVNLFLRMIEWNQVSLPVICKIGLVTKYGALVESKMTEKKLKNCTFFACSFKRSETVGNKDLFDPEDSLKIFCKLTVGENYRKEVASQTEPQMRKTNGDWVFVETDSYTNMLLLRDANVQTEQRHMGVDKALKDFEKLLDSEDATDITIKVKEKEFKAHRGILISRTPVFAAMLKHDMIEKHSGNIPLDDCESDVFKDFLHYVYTGTVTKLSYDNVFGLYVLSDKYQVEDLKEECLDCLKSILSVDTFCDVITLALKYDEEGLLALAIELFCAKMKEIIVTVKWQSFMCENPTYCNELLIKRMLYESEKCVPLA